MKYEISTHTISNQKIKNRLLDTISHAHSLSPAAIVYPYSLVNLLTNVEWIGLAKGDPWIALRQILSRLRRGVFPNLTLQQDFLRLGESCFGIGGGWRGGQTYNGAWVPPTKRGRVARENWRQGAGGCWLLQQGRVINGWTPERIMISEAGGILFSSMKTVRICEDRADVCINPEHLAFWRRAQGELQLCLGSTVLPPFLGEGIQQL